MNFYNIVGKEILLLIMAILILRIPGEGHNTLRNWASNILTVVLVVEFMVLSVDIVLWLVVQLQQYPSVLQSSEPWHLVLPLPLAQTLTVVPQVQSMVGSTVVDLAQVTL
jgi:hypothetical protein